MMVLWVVEEYDDALGWRPTIRVRDTREWARREKAAMLHVNPDRTLRVRKYVREEPFQW